jgi:LPPG:FO 2-phospho-L-lactate transferase
VLEVDLMNLKNVAHGPVVALCGGVGGAKLALGLYRNLAPGELSLIINTGDDFEHLGLHISPDIDTVTYTLAGLNNPETGWGRKRETWTFMKALEKLGGETWFSLGDGDLATHVERTHRMAGGELLSSVTTTLTKRLGISANFLPMTDDKFQTVLETNEGRLTFQDYFVRLQSKPIVEHVAFDGLETSTPGAGVLDALSQPDLQAIVVCPSNPFLSIDPILAVQGITEAIKASGAPVIAVSPLIGGQAVKGPTAKIMAELSLPRTANAIADHYGDFLDGLIIDDVDEDEVSDLSVPALSAQTLMKTLEDRVILARKVLEFSTFLSGSTNKTT